LYCTATYYKLLLKKLELVVQEWNNTCSIGEPPFDGSLLGDAALELEAEFRFEFGAELVYK
jgi:hypothetical protein